MDIVHGTCIAYDGHGLLLRGQPGSGKSDLALRAMDGGAHLVADDQVRLALRAGRVVASSPPTLFGMIEIRGLGLLRVQADVEAELAMIVDLVSPTLVERLPERRSAMLLGIALPCFAFASFEASAPAKLKLALGVVLEPGSLVT
jgi:serine kinase of HPr protein (carbohydrate metabolism regulator)